MGSGATWASSPSPSPTLAIGIAVTAAVFAVVHTVLIRPLPFPNAARLVQIVQVVAPRPGSPAREPTRAGLTHDQIAFLDAHSTTLEHIGRYTSPSATVTGIPLPVRLAGG